LAKKAKTETDKQGFASIDSGCPHYFGYLRERARGEGIPEECLACEKAVECMLLELKSPSPKTEAEKVQVAKEEQLEESLEQVTEETVEEDQFVVQNMGMLYAMWTSTVRIPKEILFLWGGKVKEVEIETSRGKKARCKVAPIESLKGKIIEVPDKVQHSLGIAKGDFVKVKPCR
jgi:uncharacterized membrane protein (UPF0127 family)